MVRSYTVLVLECDRFPRLRQITREGGETHEAAVADVQADQERGSAEGYAMRHRPPQPPADKRRELWEAILGSARRLSPQERHQATVDFLHLIISDATDGAKEDERLRLGAVAIQLWQFLSAELGAPILALLIGDLIGGDDELNARPRSKPATSFEGATEGEARRYLLQALLSIQNKTSLPTGRRALDSVAVLLPRSLFDDLIKALAALDVGTQLPLVAPRARREPAPWVSDELMLRALEHVHYQRGRGRRLKEAREHVAALLGIPSDTLRNWDQKHLCTVRAKLETARRAGELSSKLEINPDYGSRKGEKIDAFTAALLKTLGQEPLFAFAKRFRANFRR